jgi:hypothetical protein
VHERRYAEAAAVISDRALYYAIVTLAFAVLFTAFPRLIP